MNPILILSVIAGYFSLLIIISYFTSKKSDSATFFTANRKSPWYLVAFGMIGTSLSGVTFISVPGQVGTANNYFYYFQMVMGYPLGYLVIATILLPLYYRLNLVSIYSYLGKRFGQNAYYTGSAFFILSRVIGASMRLFLVAGVLQISFFSALNIPFWITVPVTLLLIWIYTNRAGIKTIVFTDTLQTFFMLLAVVITIFIIGNDLNLDLKGIINTVNDSQYSKIFDFDFTSKTNFFKQFISGAFIAIVMTGLDQDMMQKNLTCKTLREAQKNMIVFSLVLIPVNLLFLSLGALLYTYANSKGIAIPSNTDWLYPVLALNNFSMFAGIIFLLGIISAAFSSADSALTALTTGFSIDFLKLDIYGNSKTVKRKKTLVHIGFSVVLFIVIMLFDAFNDDNVINSVFRIAGYTYGPLLGMFVFGIFSKREVIDKVIPYIALISPILSYFINKYSEILLFGYKFGFELLLVNGFLTVIGMLIFSKKSQYKNAGQ